MLHFHKKKNLLEKKVFVNIILLMISLSIQNVCIYRHICPSSICESHTYFVKLEQKLLSQLEENYCNEVAKLCNRVW